MGIVFRQSIKTIIVTFSGAVLGAAILYLSTLLLARQEYGYTRNLLSIAVIVSQLLLLGLHTSLYIFIHKYPEEHKGRPVLITICLSIPIIFSVIFSIAYLLLKPYILSLYQAQDLEIVDKYFMWLPLYALFWSTITTLEQLLGAHMKVAASTFFKEVLLRIFNILVILAYGFGLINFDYFIALTVLVHIIPIAALWLMARKIKGFGFSTNWNALSKKEYKSIFDFALFHLLLTLSTTLLDNIDVIMIPLLDNQGMESVAVYAIAVYIMSLFTIPYRALSMAVTPVLTKEFQAGNMETVRDIFKRSSINIWIASLGMAALVAANLQNAISILPSKYEPAYTAVLILMIGRAANMLTGMNNEVITISKHYRFNFYLTALLIVLMVGFNLILIPKYGINGAAWGTTIAMFVHNLVKMIFLWSKFKLHPFYKGSAYVVIAALVSFIVGYIVPYILNPVIDTIVRSLIICLTYILLLIILKPSNDLKEYLNSLKKNKKLF